MLKNFFHLGLTPMVLAAVPAPVSALFQPPPHTYMVEPAGCRPVWRSFFSVDLGVPAVSTFFAGIFTFSTLLKLVYFVLLFFFRYPRTR